jgi:hypothetical protein
LLTGNTSCADDRRREILDLLSAEAVWVEPKEKVEDCRDSKDTFNYPQPEERDEHIICLSGSNLA